MLTKAQIQQAEAAALEMEVVSTPHPTLSPVEAERVSAVELELNAAQELSEAIQCLERGDRSTARIHMERAHELLNEAAIED